LGLQELVLNPGKKRNPEAVLRKGVVKSKPNFKQLSRCKKQPNRTHHGHHIEMALATGAPSWS
jgi:hypothetical protein